MGMLVRLVIPLALVAVVVVSAFMAPPEHPRTKPVPARAFQLHR